MPEANDRQAVLESCVRDLGLDERDTVSCLSLIRNQDSDGSVEVPLWKEEGEP